MQLIIHLGTEKTGTTSIQQFLTENPDLLEGLGVSYLNAFRKGISHNFLTRLLRKGEIDFVRRKVALELEKSSQETFLISSETAYGDVATQQILSALTPDALKQPDLSVTCVLYVRRQDLYLEAISKQRAKNFSVAYADAAAFARAKRPKALYHGMISRMRRLYPHVSWQVRVFDPRSFANGDVTADILSWLFLYDGPLPSKHEKRANPTPSMALIQAMQEVGVRDRFIRLNLLRALSQRPERFLFVSNDLFSGDERLDLMTYYKADNARLADLVGDDLVAKFHECDWKRESRKVMDPAKLQHSVEMCKALVLDQLSHQQGN